MDAAVHATGPDFTLSATPDDFIIECIRGFISGESSSPSGPLPPVSQVEGATQYHHLVFAMYSRLQTLDVLPEYADCLKRLSVGQAVRGAFLQSECVRVMELFEKAGLDVLVIKGPALSSAVYSNLLFGRQYDDLDFLVSPEGLEVARQLLLSQGFTDTLDLPEHSRQRHAKVWGSTLRSPDGGYMLDLQSSITPAFYGSDIPFSELSRHTVTLDGCTVPTVSNSDMLILCSTHAAKHFWERFSWVLDAAMLIRALDDAILIRSYHRACSYGVGRMFLLMCRMASELLGQPIPAVLTDAIHKDPQLVKAWQFCRSRYSYKRGHYPPRDLRAEIMYTLNLRECWSDRVSCWVKWLTMPSYTDYRIFPFPRWLHGLYYVTRPLRLLRSQVFQLHSSDRASIE